jgi:hypothetical protein
VDENEAIQPSTVESPAQEPVVNNPHRLSEDAAFAKLKAKRDAAAPKPEAKDNTKDGSEAAPAKETDEDKPEGETEAEVEEKGDGNEAEETDDTDEPTYPVKVNGEVRQVPLSELTQVYSSAKHLQGKQEIILTKERELDEGHKQVGGLVQRYQQQLGALEGMMRPNLPSQEQLTQLLTAATQATDPSDKAAATARYLQGKEAIDRFNVVQSERRRVEGEVSQRQKADRERVQAQEAELLKKARPDFANPQYVQKTVKYLQDSGITEEQIGEIDNHLAWLIIDKARRWDEHNQNIGKGVRKALKDAKPLSPSSTQEKTPPDTQARLDAKARFRAKPSFDNALQALKAKQQTA